jgi:hypothetical protein
MTVSRRSASTGNDSDRLVNRYHTIVVEEFEPLVFKKLMEFIHCGRLCITPDILLGRKTIDSSSSAFALIFIGPFLSVFCVYTTAA